jgi:hypothetical protein
MDMTLTTMNFTIKKQRPGESEDCEYYVKENDLVVIDHLSITQCFTYVGARSVGKSHVTARGFAMGYYI